MNIWSFSNNMLITKVLDQKWSRSYFYVQNEECSFFVVFHFHMRHADKKRDCEQRVVRTLHMYFQYSAKTQYRRNWGIIICSETKHQMQSCTMQNSFRILPRALWNEFLCYRRPRTQSHERKARGAAHVRTHTTQVIVVSEHDLPSRLSKLNFKRAPTFRNI